MYEQFLMKLMSWESKPGCSDKTRNYVDGTHLWPENTLIVKMFKRM